MDHPGITLDRYMKEQGMSRRELAQRTGSTEKHICTIVNGEKDISAAFARKLGYVFQNTAFWLNLQAGYDDYQMKIQEENSITPEEMEILKPLHDISNHFIEKGYMHNGCGDALKVLQLRSLLNVSNLLLIPQITYNAAYRAQLTNNIKVDPYVLFAWQKLCEKETENIEVNNNLDLEELQKRFPAIKSMMFGNINDGIKELQKIFAECGIAFQVVKNFRGAPVQGFIKETAAGRIVLCLTIRGKRADTFWFTLFHEIAHILYGDYSARFVDFDSVKGETEERADTFAGDRLIDPELYRAFVRKGNYLSWPGIENFAEKAGVQPFIVLGRLQNDMLLDWSDYPERVVRYKWA